MRQAWQDRNAASMGSDEFERAGAQMRLNLGILGALLLFSMYNQLQYLAQTWTPPHTPLTPPGPWAYLIRAIITPAAFMAAAFLAPLGEGLTLQVQAQAHRLAVMTFKVATAQWKRKLRQMQQDGQDVTGALVGLVEDPAERHVIEAIWKAMNTPPPALPGAIPSGLGVTNHPSLASEPGPRVIINPIARDETAHGMALPPAPEPAPEPAEAPTLPPPTEARKRKASAPRPKTGKPTEKRRATPRAAMGSVGDSGIGGLAHVAAVIDRAELRRRREEAARAIFNDLSEVDAATITNAELARRIAMRTHHQCSEYTAREIRAKLLSLSLEPFATEAGGADDEQTLADGGVAS